MGLMGLKVGQGRCVPRLQGTVCFPAAAFLGWWPLPPPSEPQGPARSLSGCLAPTPSFCLLSPRKDLVVTWPFWITPVIPLS